MANVNENAKESMSQCSQIIAWLLNGNRITQIEALNMFGCSRLASRIFDLRERGYDIKVESYITPSGKRVARYYMDKD